ncbi:MAG: response regulator [Chloroflexi bacterium]|nr:response regulator [Chloroflexota bacterium]
MPYQQIPPPRSKAIVLIVDDQPAIRRIMARILQTDGYELHTASNGREALDLADRLRPDVILLDVLMPDGLNGFEVCEALRKNPALADIPVIMVTALDDRESRLKGIQSGADDFIVKPFDPVELQARIENITKLNRYRRLLVERLKFEWVVEESDEGYLLVDEHDQISYANGRAQLYLGLGSATAHESFLQIVQKQYNCEPKSSWENWPVILGDRATLVRYLIRPETSQSPAFWLELTALSLPPGADASHMLRLRDVTRQMSTRKDVWQLHSMIFHKLRTPFSSVLMSLELLNDYGADMPDEERQTLYSTALNQARRLNLVIDGMLKYVDATALASSQDATPLVYLPQLVVRVCESLDLTKATCHVAADLEERAIGLTEDSLSMVLWEVLRNAQKFHPLQMPQVEISAVSLPNSYVAIQIRDNGVSLSPDQLIAVWQPYYQGERDFTGEVPGAGLGLTAVAMLIWQVGGEYKIYNRPDDQPGVVVEFILPQVG